ncbi:MAG TPA: glycosyltransferase [Acidimicrobiia bacterium]
MPDSRPQTRVLWLIKGLGPGGAEGLLVAAAGAHDRDAYDIETVYLLPWKDHLVARLETLGVPCTCLDVSSERDLRWVLRLRRLLREGNFDIVHMHSPYAAAFARATSLTLPRRHRPKLITTEHNPWTRYKRPTRLANAATAPLDSAVIAVSEEARQSLPPRQRTRARTLVHGVSVDDIGALLAERDEARAELGVDRSTVLVGTVANYHPKKDWPNLLRAARRVAELAPSVRFCLVGQGPLEAEVHALHRELGLEDVVTLTGYRADAVRLMAGCDIFVLGSRWEGLPVALMEACALHLPIVATSVGGIPDYFTDGEDALLVPPGDPGALADTIVRLAGDAELRERLAEASAEHAKQFDIHVAVETIESIYAEVLANGHS